MCSQHFHILASGIGLKIVSRDQLHNWLLKVAKDTERLEELKKGAQTWSWFRGTSNPAPANNPLVPFYINPMISFSASSIVINKDQLLATLA